MNTTEQTLKHVAPALVADGTAEYLGSSGASPQTQPRIDAGGPPESLALLVEDLARRVEAGEPIDAEAFLETHAEHEHALRQLLPAIVALAEFGNSQGAQGAVDPLAGVTDDAGRLGDFRIIREIGRGGMGVVYEAEQISLSRRVALKVLPFAGILDERQLKRFKLEATAAASLKHPNIVSVYCVGCERGVHFYAMEYVEGQTLAAVIEQMRNAEYGMRNGTACAIAGSSSSAKLTTDHRPLTTPTADTVALAAASTLTPRPAPLEPTSRDFFRTVAELGIQAAEALDHAHQIGIVHRDIKPSNLMVEVGKGARIEEQAPTKNSSPSGRGQGEGAAVSPSILDPQSSPLRLFITDFGLAHIEGHAGGTLTMTGDLLGTLRYMSPEQAEGHSAVLDHRTDIYSLGITLYELLTLQPAFTAENRQTLLKQIAGDDPPAPRKINKRIPAKLETIILKSISKDPRDRFLTAREMAEEFARYCSDRPIRSKPPSVFQRAKVWSRRHTPLVRSIVACLLIGLLSIASSVGWAVGDRAARQNLAETRANELLHEAKRFMDESKWSEALIAVKRADDLLIGTPAEMEVHLHVSRLRKDVEMVLQLEAMRQSGTNSTSEDDFVHAFRDYGIDLDKLDSRHTAERIQTCAIQIQLVEGVEALAALRRHRNDDRWKRLEKIARIADPDPWRNRLRDLALNSKSDRKPEALELFASADIDNLPPRTLMRLANLLRDLDAHDEAVSLLRTTQRLHPDELFINGELSYSYAAMEPPRLDEAIRFATAALAIQPTSSKARNNLGVFLARKGDRDCSASPPMRHLPS
jgi:serine/threonine protein kinase